MDGQTKSISDAVETSLSPDLELDLDLINRVNFASAQNGVSVLKRIILKNHAARPLEDLTLVLESRPALFRKKIWNIARIEAGGELSLTDLSTPLDPALLAGLNEAELGQISLSVHKNETCLLEQHNTVDMLARDEWGGVGEMAHLLAAYVSPNDPVVAGILKDAARLLEQAGQNGALDGYLSANPGRVWMIAGAIWSALTGLGLTYALPPASFETRGQKIRAPGRIKAEGLATCLDSALLLAACLEAAGLNAVILISEGHAWTGVWLKPRDFGTISEPDVMTVRKAVDAREFVMLETTLLTRRPAAGFETAAATARSLVNEVREHEFVEAIDISRARAARIRPLASHRPAEADEPAETSATPLPAALPQPLDTGLLPGDEIDTPPATAADRIARWQRKLLDLSLRNRLLNYKDSKQTLPLICPDISALEDELAGGNSFSTFSLKDENPLGQRDLLAGEANEINRDVARTAFARGQLATPLSGRDMNSRLLELFRRANSDLQEGGTNTLFLAAGFLRWKKAEGDARDYRAPLVLIPVRLSRRSARSDFRIEHHEDDVRFNATLLELLKRDFALHIPELEGDLPLDESGIDLPRIFDTMRRRVRDVPGFELVEELALSTFSFSKFLMWKDLVERTDSLRQSPLVRHLVDNPTEAFLAPDAPGLPAPRDIDTRVQPAELFTPLPADSSQLAAVLAAQEGHDFVLIGPPGTGKSQTIANMIAQCLAVGKTVLFVAEKSAALDVVHRRLTAHGLSDAVLELHSSKADRKSVLTQLGRSWDRAARAGTAEWVRVTDDLRLSRNRLNAYVEALHRKGTQGFSVYDAIGRVAVLPDNMLSLKFSHSGAHDAQTYQWLKRLAADAGRCHAIVAGMEPLELIGADEWSFSWQATILAQAQVLQNAGETLLAASTRLRQTAGLKPDDDGRGENLETLTAFFSVPLGGPDVSWALTHDISALRRLADDVSTLLTSHAVAERGLSAQYPLDHLSSMPLDKLDADWRLAHTKFWPLSMLAKSTVRKLLQTYASTGAAQPETDIGTLRRLADIRRDLSAIELKGCPAFHGHQTDPEALMAWTDAAEALVQALSPLQPDVSDEALWARTVQAFATGQDNRLRTLIADLFTAHEQWSQAAQAFEETAKVELSGQPLTRISRLLGLITQQHNRLQDWVAWCAARDKAMKVGLKPLVDALGAGPLTAPAADAFESAYARWWLPLAMDASDELRQFTHWSHEDLITSFRALDQKATELAADQVLRRIQHGLPTRDSVPRKSELGNLRHQIGLQRPSKPIRTLISEMPETFTRLAPCVLMSPLSVAQYLPTGQAAFDVVIFDEASQITTWDAIGAIARGRQSIIVGDPRQLPPTNFFGRSDDSESELPEEERDLASILDEVVAAGIPTQQLNWHYRSRDEALIAFSNWHYYEGRLVTFPAPQTRSQAVQLHHINGIYARGQGRTNEAEARAITRMIVQRLEEWLHLPEDDRLTLGVITFNAEQQRLILDLLDEERRNNPDLEWYFDDDRLEPVIVKNLENIQGDERDIMLFSITFGPDAAGKLSMAFGALNGEGGEKRLNVAITRARRELHIFASIHADDIDLTRTRALGVKHLKAFLDFANRGPVALPAQDEGSLGPTENMFENAVRTAIEARGWEVRTQIGVSGFRIDLGVVHPDHAGAYLAGIECDGATYHSSASARDRDKVRQAVLEGLGWNILRVWSADWFRDARAVTTRVDEALTSLLEQDRASREARRAAEEVVQKDAARKKVKQEQYIIHADVGEIGPDTGSGAADADKDGMTSLPADDASGAAHFPDASSAQTSVAPPVNDGDAHAWQRVVANASATLATQTGVPQRHPRPHAGKARDRASAAHFYDHSYDPILQDIIAEIATEDGPLPLDQMERQIAQIHGWHRTGRRIQQRVQQCLSVVTCEDENGRIFVWPPQADTRRTPFRIGLNRHIRDISRAEIADLIDHNAQRLRLAEDREQDLARLAGIARLTAETRAYLADCIAWTGFGQTN